MSAQQGTKPPHPDLPRRVIAFLGFAILVVGYWGAPATWWVVHHNRRWEDELRRHLPLFALLRQGFHDGAWWLLGITALGCLWTACIWLRWYWRVAQIEGQYLTLVVPRPQRRRATGANPEAAALLWDRLIATLDPPEARGMPPYLATELWGDVSGQVQWGVWLPAHMHTRRDVVRRLMTAERPEARLVDAPDPLRRALDRDDQDDTGTRWYADAILILRARDHYPLPDDALTLRSLVAALRPPRTVLASGISVIATPAPSGWAPRVHRQVQRWRWEVRSASSVGEHRVEEIDAISLKAQQAHAWVCLRVHVVALSRAAALRECRSLLTTLQTSRKRYAAASQYWQPRRIWVRQIHGTRLPTAGRTRAPFRPLPRLLPVFPFV